MAQEKTRKSIGAYLLGKGAITSEQLDEAMKKQLANGEQLGKILSEQGYINETTLTKALSEQLKIPFVDLTTYKFDLETIKIIPEKTAKRYNIIALTKLDKFLTIASSDPLNVLMIDDIQNITKFSVEAMFAAESKIKEAIAELYSQKASAGPQTIEDELSKSFLTEGETKITGDVDELKKAADGNSIISQVDKIIQESVNKNASDIHLEPQEKHFLVRIRIDGILYIMTKIPKELQAPVISRIKIMAEMNIAERRLPQDGRIGLKMDKKEIELRVSTFPTIYGENVVMRILNKSMTLLKLEDLGFNGGQLQQFREVITQPYGIILITGPTGSGKTTTLYAVLAEINSVKKNILTLEEPVEYRIPRIRQTQINPKAGLTFASGLRSILRQDPDVIMIGEIRDMETAKMAIRSASTGHLVLSTLHTNDALNSISRLIDMGVEPYLVSPAIIAVAAQRLIRNLCPACKTAYTPDEKLLQSLNLTGAPRDYKFYKEGKCDDCFNIGYKGRTVLFELLIMDEELRELLVTQSSTSAEFKTRAAQKGLTTLRQNGIDKIIAGITSVAEVMQLT